MAIAQEVTKPIEVVPPQALTGLGLRPHVLPAILARAAVPKVVPIGVQIPVPGPTSRTEVLHREQAEEVIGVQVAALLEVVVAAIGVRVVALQGAVEEALGVQVAALPEAVVAA